MVESELKEVLGEHPGDVLAQRIFPHEYRIAISERTEWEHHYHMSILFVLLRGRSQQEENPEIGFSNDRQNRNWQMRWRSMRLDLTLERGKRRYGYRIANLLGCEWVNDREIGVARLVFDAILALDSHIGHSLRRTHFDDLLFCEIGSYLSNLLGIEVVPLQQSY
jgi:hypothetical protein